MRSLLEVLVNYLRGRYEGRRGGGTEKEKSVMGRAESASSEVFSRVGQGEGDGGGKEVRTVGNFRPGSARKIKKIDFKEVLGGGGEGVGRRNKEGRGEENKGEMGCSVES